MVKTESFPKVSIIIPAYNAERSIEKCICSALDQKYLKENYEVLAVDNNSTDNTASIIKSCTDAGYILEKDRQNCFAACNTGARHAHTGVPHRLRQNDSHRAISAYAPKRPGPCLGDQPAYSFRFWSDPLLLSQDLGAAEKIPV